MKSFIRELYYGNIDPQAKTFDRDSAYGKALETTVNKEAVLADLLPEKEKALFLDYVNAWDEVLGITAAETFVDGFRIGAAFMLDTFINTGSAFIDICSEIEP